MKIFVGLGNPGDKYTTTRHNIGFTVLEKFQKEFNTSEETGFAENKKFKSEIKQIEWNRKKGKELVEKIILVKPNTFMNNSGLAVSIISSFYKIKPEDIWVIHDDLDLPAGTIKIRFGGASAGHKGVDSIIESLKTDKFWRIRIGIGHPHNEPDENGNLKTKISKRKLGSVDSFVLGKFGKGEKNKTIIKKVVKAIEAILEDGPEKAMNRFNTR